MIDSLRQGGAERSCQLLALYLQARGWQVQFIIFEGRQAVFRQELELAGVSVEVLGWHNVLYDVLHLKRAVAAFRPDIILCCLLKSAHRTRLIMPFFPHVPMVESLVNTEYAAITGDQLPQQLSRLDWLKMSLTRAVNCLSARCLGQYYHAISQVVADWYLPLFRYKADSVRVISRGRPELIPLSKELRAVIRREYFGVGDEAIVCINVGRHEKQKNQDLLIEVMLKVLDKPTSENVHCVVVGREGSTTDALTNKISASQFSAQIKLLGFRDNVPALLQAADLFIFPSLYEGLGGALIEAFSAALPVIATDIAVLKEVSRGTDGVVFFENNSADDLACQVLELLENRHRWQAMGRANQGLFERQYHAGLIHQQMEQMLMAFIGKEG
ncbi:MAG: glycosyltransferase family 4 protein [Pseudomonadales bacterium]|nr:glycosyltransferase family 4 protein [Pseudomonadales bacterium]